MSLAFEPSINHHKNKEHSPAHQSQPAFRKSRAVSVEQHCCACAEILLAMAAAETACFIDFSCSGPTTQTHSPTQLTMRPFRVEPSSSSRHVSSVQLQIKGKCNAIYSKTILQIKNSNIAT